MTADVSGLSKVSKKLYETACKAAKYCVIIQGFADRSEDGKEGKSSL